MKTAGSGIIRGSIPSRCCVPPGRISLPGRVISGGSTLTMQVARLLDPHPRTFGGKLRQLWRALQLEWHLSKSDILTLYLNRAPFGGTLQGIGAASWAYLGKPPAQLSYGEAALLAVLPQAPSRLRPDRWPQRAQAARDKVLTRMVSQGVWPQRGGTGSDGRAGVAVSAADAAAGAAFCAPGAGDQSVMKRWRRRSMPGCSGSWKIWR